MDQKGLIDLFVWEMIKEGFVKGREMLVIDAVHASMFNEFETALVDYMYEIQKTKQDEIFI